MTRAQGRGARNALGRWGEDVAARHLEALGMVVLERNWQCPDGEIDLVLRDGHDLVVCEVKTRRGTGYGTPAEGVDGRKAARLRRLAYAWLRAHGVRVRDVRIDVVGVLAPRGADPEVEHLRGIA